MRVTDSPCGAVPAPFAVMFHAPAQGSRHQTERLCMSTATTGTAAGRLVPGIVYISKREREREREREDRGENCAWLITPCIEFPFLQKLSDASSIHLLAWDALCDTARVPDRHLPGGTAARKRPPPQTRPAHLLVHRCLLRLPLYAVATVFPLRLWDANARSALSSRRYVRPLPSRCRASSGSRPAYRAIPH